MNSNRILHVTSTNSKTESTESILSIKNQINLMQNANLINLDNTQVKQDNTLLNLQQMQIVCLLNEYQAWQREISQNTILINNLMTFCMNLKNRQPTQNTY
jgi:hypothetical protein